MAHYLHPKTTLPILLWLASTLLFMYPRSTFAQGEPQGLQQLMDAKQARNASGTILSGPIHLIVAHFQEEQGLPISAQVNSMEMSLYFDKDIYSFDEKGRLGITVRTNGNSGLLELMQTYGFQESGNSPKHQIIEGYIPWERILELDELSSFGMLSVMPMYKPILDVGSVENEASEVLQADRVRGTAPSNYDGTGVSIGVLSDSYDNLSGAATGIGSGDLPAGGVTVILDGTGGTDEGRAMLELIHDVAPGASLFFATANGGETAYANNIQSLANAGCKVIVDDVVYLAEPFFQNGIVGQKVNDVSNIDDVIYFSSAGNRDVQAYESSTISFINDNTFGTTVSAYDFNLTAGVDHLQSITLNTNESIQFSFQWDDPWFTGSGVDTDLDILIADASNTIVASSVFSNTLIQSPIELLTYTNLGASGNFNIYIYRSLGPNPGRIKYVNFGTSNVYNEYVTNSPTVNPHAAAEKAIAVAAAPYFERTPESFTSHGPSTFIFEDNGSLKPSIEVRQTPDFTATDAVNNTFFGSDAEGDGNPNFFGTSAAAPNAAAVAALVRQANPASNRDAIYNLMNASARDIGGAGFDNITGSGIIDAYRSVFSPGTPAALPVSDGLEDGEFSVAWELNYDFRSRMRVTGSNTPATGSFHILMDAWFTSATLSLNEAILHFDATNLGNIDLSFDHRDLGDEDHPMPASFTGSGNYDGVALSVDGTNWFRLISLDGVNAPATYTTRNIDISAAAAANTLTLGSDVMIKFQQYDNFNISATCPTNCDGFAFDNITLTGVSLPITLASLAGEQIRNEGIMVRWATDKEVNNDFFTLERSADGLDFQPVTQVDGAGNADETRSYNYLDRNPSIGVNYYRLRQTDFDGTETVSATVEVAYEQGNNFQIKSNPVTGNQLQLSLFAEQASTLTGSIVDMNGRQLEQVSLQAQEGRTNYQVDISNLASGMYVLQFKVNGQLIQDRFLKM